MYPEEAVQAAIDSKVHRAVPVHWGAFSLALHHWADPIERFVEASEKKHQQYLCPRPGEIIQMGQVESNAWWKKYL
jgi:L-ascorbate metabolism protein UlaG (beta-lactamase superfamily)